MSLIYCLIVEDDPAVAESFRLGLESITAGGSTRIVASVAGTIGHAVEELKTKHYDITLLDLKLPNGAGEYSFMRVFTAKPTVPIIVMTCLDDPGLEETLVTRGAEDFIRKGDVRFEELIVRMRIAIANHAAEAKFKVFEKSLTDYKECSDRVVEVAAQIDPNVKP